ncbi:hypothetical protein BCD67_11550 [Oscillatoriales cyanobacterium USR001]|nr:hypothetical protein BCD67_11550 [Oscillatoriales cyanobacterium USR001]
MNKNRLVSALFFLLSFVLLVQSCINQVKNSQLDNNIQSGNTTEPTPNKSAEIPKEPVKITASPTPKTSPSPLAKFDLVKSAKLTDTAKLIAGIKVDNSSIDNSSLVVEVQNSSAWINHAQYFQNGWPQLENQQLSKVRKWSQEELKSINDSAPSIFYPFSGPDFLYAYSFFPKAKEYVLIGLEPVGVIPDFKNMSDSQRAQKLAIINQSLYAILEYSFFRTKAMAVDLANYGVLPILLLFMARTNHQILDVQYVGLDEEAKIQVVEEESPQNNGLIPGVKISLLPQGESEPKVIYYFSTDLSNDGLQKHPAFVKFMKQYAKESVTYLKAASYLMHNESFSTIRDVILTQSSAVLQDDSGVPVKHFDKSVWESKFYGAYIKPIDIFANQYQSDLRSIYQGDSSIKPLDFGIGYKFYKDSNLMLAIRKGESVKQEK